MNIDSCTIIAKSCSRRVCLSGKKMAAPLSSVLLTSCFKVFNAVDSPSLLSTTAQKEKRKGCVSLP